MSRPPATAAAGRSRKADAGCQTPSGSADALDDKVTDIEITPFTM